MTSDSDTGNMINNHNNEIKSEEGKYGGGNI
jgi:hypothetical protein